MLLRQATDAARAGRPVRLPTLLPDDFRRWLRGITNRHIVSQTKALGKYTERPRSAVVDSLAMQQDAFRFWRVELQARGGRKRKQ